MAKDVTFCKNREKSGATAQTADKGLNPGQGPYSDLGSCPGKHGLQLLAEIRLSNHPREIDVIFRPLSVLTAVQAAIEGLALATEQGGISGQP